MNQRERLIYLIQYLCQEKKLAIELPQSHDELFGFYRALVNIREAGAVPLEFLRIQDQMLQEETRKKGIVDFDDTDQDIILWKGDITRLKVDAIVNAANDRMEGCFIPGHHCIDNAIHTFAGIQLREDCHRMMMNQGFFEPTGKAKITSAYNLPSRYILHTVGPIVRGRVTHQDEKLLTSCYESCLQLADEYQLKSIAFCCISTGVFHFPNDRAAKIAVQTVKKYLERSGIRKVIFNVFKDEDEKIYQKLLKSGE